MSNSKLVFERKQARVPIKFYADQELYLEFKNAVEKNELQISDTLCELMRYFIDQNKQGNIEFKII